MPQTPSAEHDQRLERILADYLHAVEAGEAQDRDALMRQHPDLADELHSFFRNRDAIERLARPLKEQGPPLPETLGSEGGAESGVGTTIRYFGDYELLEEIARGGMGVVYRARQVTLNRIVALKMILEGELATVQEVQRFRQEAEAVGNLDHPNIVPIYETGEHNGRHYFSMKLIEGGNLAQKVPAFLLDQKAAARLLATVARGVHYAHQRGVLHRDLKPANILLDRQGQPHVTDFGLAKRVGADRGQTQSGAVVGTPSYMAPEQAGASKDLSTAVDVYSLGAIFYELLTGSPPFRAETPLETLRQVVGCEPEQLRRRKPDVDADLETICLKCLEKDPRRRYDSALALAEELERWLRGEPISARPVSSRERLWRWCRRNPLVAGLAAAVLLVLTAGAITSSYLGIEAARSAHLAEQRAEEADEERKRAKQNEEQARKNEERALEQEKQARLEKERGDRQLSLAELRLYAGQLARAQREWQDGNGARALQVLGRCQWDLRDVEFRLLWSLYTSNQLTLDGLNGRLTPEAFTPTGTRALTGVAFSPDGKRIVSASWFEGLRLWDLEKRRAVLQFGAREVDGVAFGPDGKRIVSRSQRQGLHVWDAISGRGLFSLKGHTGEVTDVAFSPNGKLIVTGSRDKTLKVWGAEKGQVLLTLRGHTQSVFGVAFSPDGKRILSASADGTLKVWEAGKGQHVLTRKWNVDLVTRVAFSPDGNRLVSVRSDGTLKVWDIQKGQELLTLKGHTQPIRSVGFSPDGTRIVSGSEDGTLRVWDAQTGNVVLSLKGHVREVTGVAFSPDGRRIASSSSDRTLKVWDAEKGQEVHTLKGHTKPVRCLAIRRPDGQRIVTGGGGHDRRGNGLPGTLTVWDAERGQVLHTLKGHTEPVRCVAFSPDGKRIVSGSEDKTLKVWDAENGKEVRTLKGGPSGVNSVAFSLDGKRIVSEDSDSASARVWDAETGRALLSLKGGHERAVTSVAFSPDGKRIVTGSLDWTLKVWDAQTGKHLLTLKGHTNNVTSVCFSPDGKRIVSGGDDNTLKVWDVQTGEELLTLRGHAKPVLSVAYSPDGKRIVSGSEDGALKVWGSATGQGLLTLKEHRGPVYGVAFSADGNRLVSGSEDGTLKVWDARRSQAVLSLEEDDVTALSMAFSPDGKRLVVGYVGGTVKVWDGRKGQVVLSLKGLTDIVTSVAFSRDGKRISGKEKTETREKVLTWDATTGRLLPDARPAPLEERGSEDEITNPAGSLRASATDDGEIKVVRLPGPVEARKRRQEQDRAFLERLARPDPAYHRRKADLYEKSGEDFAAAFHLRRLLRIEPTGAVRKRLAAVEARMEAAVKSETSLPEKRPTRMPYAR